MAPTGIQKEKPEDVKRKHRGKPAHENPIREHETKKDLRQLTPLWDQLRDPG